MDVESPALVDVDGRPVTFSMPADLKELGLDELVEMYHQAMTMIRDRPRADGGWILKDRPGAGARRGWLTGSAGGSETGDAEGLGPEEVSPAGRRTAAERGFALSGPYMRPLGQKETARTRRAVGAGQRLAGGVGSDSTTTRARRNLSNSGRMTR